MNRVALISKLESVSPALASSDMVPILTHFRFSGKRVMAFNDHIAISAPCVTDFATCVPGNMLLSLLKASKAKEIEFDHDGDTLNIKAASSRFKVGTKPYDEYPFSMPKMDEDTSHAIVGDQDQLTGALDACMRIVSMDTDVPEKLGVTIVHEGKAITMYSTDGNAMCRAVMQLKSDPTKTKPRFILSAPFCAQLLKIAPRGKFKQFQVHKEHSMLTIEDGTTLYGRLIDSEKPLEFENVFQHHFGKDARARLVSIPTKLEGALERACIIAANKLESISTKCSVSEGKAKFYTQSTMGEVTDTVQLEDKHPNAIVTFDPKLLRQAYGHYDQILFMSHSIVLTSDTNTYLVSAQASREK